MSDKGERGERFLARWSRKKREKTVFGEDETATPPAIVRQREEPHSLSGEPKPDMPEVSKDMQELSSEELKELESIDIETLEYDADFSKFLREGVPKALKQRALRRLWSTNPVLANVDGLNDYDANFFKEHKIIDKFESAYRVGKGYLDKLTEGEDAKTGESESGETDVANEGDSASSSEEALVEPDVIEGNVTDPAMPETEPKSA